MPSGIYLRKSLIDRFFPRIRRTLTCWIWTGAATRHGYGVIGLNNKLLQAHRASWIIHFGPIPEGMWVLHKCDNRACVNPKHLFIGTRKDNVADCVSKKRHIWGEKHTWTKLTVKQVKQIRKSKLSQNKLAEKFNVHQTTIHCIKRNKSWRHL